MVPLLSGPCWCVVGYWMMDFEWSSSALSLLHSCCSTYMWHKWSLDLLALIRWPAQHVHTPGISNTADTTILSQSNVWTTWSRTRKQIMQKWAKPLSILICVLIAEPNNYCTGSLTVELLWRGINVLVATWQQEASAAQLNTLNRENKLAVRLFWVQVTSAHFQMQICATKRC